MLESRPSCISSNPNQERRKLVICPKRGLGWVIPSAQLRELCSGSKLAGEAHLSSFCCVDQLAKRVVESRILWPGPDHVDQKLPTFIP